MVRAAPHSSFRVSFALTLLLVGLPVAVASQQDVGSTAASPLPWASPAALPDSLVHPITLACGERLDPLGAILGEADEIGLDSVQVAAIEAAEARMGGGSPPGGAAPWGDGPVSPPVPGGDRRIG